MNAADRAGLQQLLATAIAQAIPVFGEATVHHMALTLVNLIEAIEDVENYLGNQLDDENRERLGI